MKNEEYTNGNIPLGAEAVLPDGTEVKYSVFRETEDGRTFFSLGVETEYERTVLRDVSASLFGASSLMLTLCAGTVTPCTARDVAEDFITGETEITVKFL